MESSAALGYVSGRKRTIDAHVSRERPVEGVREGSSTRARITGPSENAAAALAAKVAAAAASSPVPASQAAPATPSLPAKTEPVISDAPAKPTEMVDGTGRGLRRMRRGVRFAEAAPSVPASPEKQKTTIQPVMVLPEGRLLHPVTSVPVEVGSTVFIAVKDLMSDCSVTVWTASVDEKDSTRTFPAAAIAAKMSEDLKLFYENVVKKIGTPAVGQPLAVRRAAGLWYRGKFLGMENNHFLVYFVDLGEVHEIENSSDVYTLDQRFVHVPSAAVVVKIFGTPKKLSAGQKMVIEAWILDNYKPEDIIVADVVAVQPTVELRIVLAETTLPLVLLKKELEDQKRDARAGTVLLAEHGARGMFVLKKEKAAESNKLQDEIQKLAAKASVPATIKMEDHAVLFEEENTWYRAIVFQAEGQKEDEYTAELSDYGNVITVKKGHVRQLPDSFFALDKMNITDVIRIYGLTEEQMKVPASIEKFKALQNEPCLYEIVTKPDEKIHQSTVKFWDQDGVQQSKEIVSVQKNKRYKHRLSDMKEKVEIKKGVSVPVHASFLVDPELMFLSHGKEPSIGVVADLNSEVGHRTSGVRNRFPIQSQETDKSERDEPLVNRIKRITLECAVGTKMKNFALSGGAERAAFVTVSAVDHSLVPYKNTELRVAAVDSSGKRGIWQRLMKFAKPSVNQVENPPRLQGQFAVGDFLLSVGGGCVVGFRLRECAALISAMVGGRDGALVIEILPVEAFETTSLREMVERSVVAEPRSFEWSLRRMMRINLERDIVPCTTRPRRPSDKKYGEYYFVEDEFFNMCEDQLTMIDFGEYNGYRYGYERPNDLIDTTRAHLTAKELNKYLNCKIRPRNDSFDRALGYSLTAEERDRTKARPIHFSRV